MSGTYTTFVRIFFNYFSSMLKTLSLYDETTYVTESSETSCCERECVVTVSFLQDFINFYYKVTSIGLDNHLYVSLLQCPNTTKREREYEIGVALRRESCLYVYTVRHTSSVILYKL